MLEVLIGNIASGKSTYARKRAAEGWFVVSDDDIINMLLAQQYNLYKRAYRPLVTSLMRLSVLYLVQQRYNVVVDSTWNADPSVMNYWKSIAEVQLVVFPQDAPEVHAARRFAHDPRGTSYEEWLEVAIRIDASIKNISL